MKFLSVRSDICRQLPSDSTSRWTPLPLTMQFPLLGLARDLHPLDNAHAERTKKHPDCSRNRDVSIYGEMTVISQSPLHRLRCRHRAASPRCGSCLPRRHGARVSRRRCRRVRWLLSHFQQPLHQLCHRHGVRRL